MNTVTQSADSMKIVGELPPEKLAGLEIWGKQVGIQVQAYREVTLADLVQSLVHMTKVKQESYKGPRRKLKIA